MEQISPNSVDVLILGGGYGTRLLEDASPRIYTPKGLIDMVGKPAVERNIEAFLSPAINRIVLETNNEGAKPYASWISRYSEGGRIELFVEPLSNSRECLGVLQTISYVHDHKSFTKPVLIVAPDNIFFETQEHIFNNAGDSYVKMLTYDVKSFESATKYGVLTLSDSRVIHCEEKPQKPASTIVRTACELWQPDIFNMLGDWVGTGETDKVGRFIQYLIQSGIDVKSCPVRGDWKDIGTKYDLKQTRKLWKQKTVQEQ